MLQPDQPPATPHIRYSARDAATLLADPGLLAMFDFGAGLQATTEPRALHVRLGTSGAATLRETWSVAAPVRSGRDGELQWAEGGGWLFVAIETDDLGDVRASALCAYDALTGCLRQRPDFHVQRLWNYLDDINAGNGDHERYRQFCAGRLLGMGSYFAEGFPAATATGHPTRTGKLQVYCLAAHATGHRIENPRQVSAWCYPRQYGPVSPSFARAMRLPGGDALAISGTAAIQGHASRHDGDLQAQFGETMANLESLFVAGRMPGSLGRGSLLKVYVRHAEHMTAVDALLAERLPEATWMLLQADICRRELLVEIDGWHFA